MYKVIVPLPFTLRANIPGTKIQHKVPYLCTYMYVCLECMYVHYVHMYIGPIDTAKACAHMYVCTHACTHTLIASMHMLF